MPEDSKLYIGNIPYDVTRDELRRKFDKFGPIEEIKIVMDRVTERPKGFAFVTFENVADSRDAIEEMDGTDLYGRQINVEKSRNDDSRSRQRYDRERNRRSDRDYDSRDRRGGRDYGHDRDSQQRSDRYSRDRRDNARSYR